MTISSLTNYISNIDATYPKRGQDNSSQGFRDNFTNIKSGLTTIRDQIDGTTLLKGTTSTTRAENADDYQNYMVGAEIREVQLADWTQRLFRRAAVTGTVLVSFTDAPIHYLETAGDITVQLREFPIDQYSSLRLYVDILSTSTTVTFSDISSVTNAALLPNLTGGVMRSDFVGTYGIEISSVDGLQYTFSDLIDRKIDQTQQTLSGVAVTGDFNDLINVPVASKVTQGVMQVGDGLQVAAGVVSVILRPL